MKRLRISLAIVALVGSGSVVAQSTGELYKMSNHNFSLSTARVAAMGGAYTSLGADASSMSINPAGLAMYRSSEVSITPSLAITNNTTNVSGANSTSLSNVKAMLSNAAGIFAMPSLGFTLGVGYNKLADFSGRREFQGREQNGSMTQIFAHQLEGIPFENLSSKKDLYQAFYRYDPYRWNPIMAYQTGLINTINNDHTYTSEGIFNSTDYQTPNSYIKTNGAIGEFTLSGAYNYDDILYAGMTMGFQNIEYGEDWGYSETANLARNGGALDNFTIRQRLRTTGFGFNLKLGVIVRPTPWIRIGLAYHTPTWMTTRETNYTDLTAYYRLGSNLSPGFSDTPELRNSYYNRTPSRLMAGLSFTIAKRLIISGDYELTWYNDMKFQTPINQVGYRPQNTSTAIDNQPNAAINQNYAGDIDLNNIITTYYQPVHTLRLGIEAQPHNGFFIRAGFSHSTSPYKSMNDQVYGDPSKYGAITSYSGGLGYRGRMFGVDIAYTYRTMSNLPTKFYDYVFVAPSGEAYNYLSEGLGYNKTTNHNVLLTFSFKFGNS